MTAVYKQKFWHSLSAKEVLKEIDSSPSGLSFGEANLRLDKYGLNTFEYIERFRFLKLLWRQIRSPLVFILVIAGFVTLFLGEYTDSIVILIAVTINTIIGIFQEGKASQAFAKLKGSQKKYATVIREGKKQVVLADNVVPGDVLMLSVGEQVSADARIVESKGLEANEAILTGEWMSNSKDTRKIKKDTPLADRSNMVWMGTFVTEGWGTAVVVETGFKTEIGKIAKMLGEEKAPLTDFQKNIKKLATFLGLLILGALVVIFALGIFRGEAISQMFFTSVAIAVAAIPEGLPVVVTVVLAIGMERILANGGLIKRLNAAETLGSVDIILTDKTGTLTQAIMSVSGVITLDSLEKEKRSAKESDDKVKILEMALLSAGGFIENPEANLADWVVRGTPIEQAIIVAGIESKLYHHSLLEENPRIDFLEFESERRFSASLHGLKENQKNRFFITGAPELILSLSKKIYKNGRVISLSEKHRDLLLNVLEKHASYGARLVAVGYKDCDCKEFPRSGSGELFKDFVFGGLIVFHDPLRPDVKESLKKAEQAGIRTIMMTGDHKKTARKIGEDVGIFKKGTRIIDGDMLDKLSDKDLKNAIKETTVFARVVPHQKVRVVKAWQAQGKSVAMTGDGVNDAPSLKRAELGICLNDGTEVAKEASDMILLNNSFSVIISAIEEGRKILLNFRKVLVYLLSTGFSEIILVGVSLFLGMPLPILPAQILWTNLIEEGFMNFAFAFEPGEKDIMKRSPKSFSPKTFLVKDVRTLIIILSFFTSLLLIVVFLVSHLVFKNPLEYTRTIVFGALSIDSIFFAFSLKNFRKPVWKINIFSNLYLIAAVFVSFAFLAGALFVPQLRFLLSLQKIGLSDILIILTVGFINIFAIETAKHFLTNKENKEKIK